jgi:hypothetical protein
VASARRAATASHSRAVAFGRKPIATATPTTTASPAMVRMVLPSTWPDSTAALAMPIVRNRAMIPSAMSMDTEIAVPWATPTIAMSRMPGVT